MVLLLQNLKSPHLLGKLYLCRDGISSFILDYITQTLQYVTFQLLGFPISTLWKRTCHMYHSGVSLCNVRGRSLKKYL